MNSQQFQATFEALRAFNEPYKTAVAINCAYIGDDNEYSIFLLRAVTALWKANQKQLAFELYRTDPMINKEPTFADFFTFITHRIANEDIH